MQIHQNISFNITLYDHRYPNSPPPMLQRHNNGLVTSIYHLLDHIFQQISNTLHWLKITMQLLSFIISMFICIDFLYVCVILHTCVLSLFKYGTTHMQVYNQVQGLNMSLQRSFPLHFECSLNSIHFLLMLPTSWVECESCELTSWKVYILHLLCYSISSVIDQHLRIL